MTIAIIVQARMGSTRFPGKILHPFLPVLQGGPRVSVLEHVLRRCKGVPKIDMVILATPDTPDHVDAWDIAGKLGCHVATGLEHDVLSRYYEAAELYDLKAGDHIVRVTADCPLISPRVIHECITLHRAQQADYTSNVLPRTYPKGFDCEVMAFAALEAAWAVCKEPYDREHVTPWLRRDQDIVRANLCQKRDQSDINLCVDYPEDPARIELLIKSSGPLMTGRMQ